MSRTGHTSRYSSCFIRQAARSFFQPDHAGSCHTALWRLHRASIQYPTSASDGERAGGFSRHSSIRPMCRRDGLRP